MYIIRLKLSIILYKKLKNNKTFYPGKNSLLIYYPLLSLFKISNTYILIILYN